MSGALGSIGGALGNLWGGMSGTQKALLPLTAFSGIEQILAGHQQQSLINQMAQRAKYAESLSPQAITAMAERSAAPLSAGLISNVGNLVQGVMAERGLAQAPGIYGSEMASALAPYEQQNLQQAYNAVLQQIYGPISALGSALGGAQSTQSGFGPLLLAMLSSGRAGGGGASPIDLSQLGALFPSIYGGGGSIWNPPQPEIPDMGGLTQ
jgi:hypothetical protein